MRTFAVEEEERKNKTDPEKRRGDYWARPQETPEVGRLASAPRAESVLEKRKDAWFSETGGRGASTRAATGRPRSEGEAAAGVGGGPHSRGSTRAYRRPGAVQTEVSLLSLIIKTSEKYEEENKDHLSPHWADFGPVDKGSQ